MEKTRLSTIKMCMFFLFTFAFGAHTVINAQGGGTAILPFAEGKILSSDDINFLNYVINGIGKAADSRGVLTDVKVGNSKLTEGTKISKQDAVNIHKILLNFSESENSLTTDSPDKTPGSRGASTWCGYCCYYYWWDSWCGCYRYTWYYCCAC